MRVAIVTYALNLGGVETCCRLLAGYLLKQNHEVVFVETSSKGCCSEDFTRAGFKVLSVLIKPWETPRAHVCRVIDALRGCQAVLLNDAPLAQAGLGLLDDSVVAVPILHMNVPSMVQTATSKPENWDVLCGVCPAVAGIAREHGRLAKEKVTYIPNGVPVPATWPKSSAQFSTPKLRVAFIGRVEHAQKGVFYLPDILAGVLASAPMELDVVGNGPDLEALQEACRAKGVAESCRFHNALSHEATMAVLSQAQVMLMPSHYEGLPLVLLEAMAQGVVPVVSHLSGCTDYVLGNPPAGVLAAVGDVKAMAQGIVSLHQDRVRLQDLSMRAWQRAHDCFSFATTGDSYLKLIGECQLRRQAGWIRSRTGKIEERLLGDLVGVPSILRRPVRKVLRIVLRQRPS